MEMSTNHYQYPLGSLSLEETVKRDFLVSFRLEKTQHKIFGDKKIVTKFLPFHGVDFPLIERYQTHAFLKGTRISHLYEEQRDSVKEIICKADKMNYFEYLFKKYLADINMTNEDYISLSDEEKNSIVENWQNQNAIPENYSDISQI
jgi:hypothetical protein